jgi:hypothetical protein
MIWFDVRGSEVSNRDVRHRRQGRAREAAQNEPGPDL